MKKVKKKRWKKNNVSEPVFKMKRYNFFYFVCKLIKWNTSKEYKAEENIHIFVWKKTVALFF